MNRVVFDGKSFASERVPALRTRISSLDVPPKLVSFYFAEDPGSILYTTLKQRAAKRVGINFQAVKASFKDEVDALLRLIQEYCQDPAAHGVMIQKPAQSVFFTQHGTEWAGGGVMRTFAKNLEYFLSSKGMGKGTDEWWRRLTSEIVPHKDVDCMTSVNLDRVYRGKWTIVPATVRAVLSIIEVALRPSSGQALRASSLADQRAVVVGRSEIVGMPLAHVLAQKGASVSLCASTGVVARSRGSQLLKVRGFEEIAREIRKADIVVSATGKPGIITGEMVKKGAIVIDVGAPEGDVDFDSVSKKACFITPVPGGVGPVTIVSLLENLLDLL